MPQKATTQPGQYIAPPGKYDTDTQAVVNAVAVVSAQAAANAAELAYMKLLLVSIATKVGAPIPA